MGSANVFNGLIRQGDSAVAEQARGTNWNAEARAFDMRSLARLAIWGTSAATALVVAVAAGYSDMGSHRLAVAMASIGGAGDAQSPSVVQVAARSVESENETRRLAEEVRTLNADREQLLTRITALERNIEDITGSIKTRAASPATPKAAEPAPPAALAHQSTSETTSPAAAIQIANATAAETNSTKQVVTKPQFGIDIGGALNFDRLRTLWHVTKRSNVALFENLYPIVIVRENSRTHAAELRLVVGPFSDEESAIQLCTTLSAIRRHCEPTAFSGQRLTLAEPAQERAPVPVPPRQRPSRPNP